MSSSRSPRLESYDSQWDNMEFCQQSLAPERTNGMSATVSNDDLVGSLAKVSFYIGDRTNFESEGMAQTGDVDMHRERMGSDDSSLRNLMSRTHLPSITPPGRATQSAQEDQESLLTGIVSLLDSSDIDFEHYAASNSSKAIPLDTSGEPSHKSRLSSLDLYPQHVFPSQLNEIPYDRQVPYAFSHSQTAFYLTREDALKDRKLNIWASPPCLNCIMTGEEVASKCDRYKRQEESFGKIQWCSRCERIGDTNSCIEQIEIRTDGKLSHIKNLERETTIWDAEEVMLRRKGLVVWKPINLHVGDFVKKAELEEVYRRTHVNTMALPEANLAYKMSPQQIKEARIEADEFNQRRLRGVRFASQLVADWDREDLASSSD